MGIIAFVWNIAAPILIFRILMRIKGERSEKERFESIIEDYDMTDNFKKYFTPIQMVRRFVVSFGMVVCYHLPIL